MNYFYLQLACWILFFLVIVALQSEGHTNTFNRVSRILSRRAGKDRLLQGYESILIRKDPTSTTVLLGSNPRKLTGIRIDREGKICSFEIAKQQLASELLLPLRDLRIVDPSYPSQIQATIVVRPNVILFSFDHLKMMIKNSEAFIFNANREEVRKFVSLLQQQLVVQSQLEASKERNQTEISYNQTSSSGDDSQQEYSLSLTEQRFEHVVLETALSFTTVTLSSAIRSLEPAVAAALLDLRVVSRGLDVIQTQVDELLPLKNKIDELRKRCVEIKQCIFEILNSDEDMQMMFLESASSLDESKTETQNTSVMKHKKRRSKRNIIHPSSTEPLVKKLDRHQRKRIRSTQSLEILLENYLNEVEWATSEVDDMLNEITNTEENVVLQLDLIRNRILKFELYLSISSFVVTCGALITGLFGMNLLNHFELDKRMFYIVSVFLFSSMVMGFRSFMKYARNQKLL